MASPPFTEGQLRFYMRQPDVRVYQLGTSEEQILKKLLDAKESLNSPAYAIDLASPFLKGNELVFEPARFEDKLFLRYLNGRLCRAYKIRPPDRNAIVRQVHVILKADAYLNIVRADIRRFFRCINFTWLVELLRRDGLLSSLEINTIMRIAEFTAKFQTSGIPWGLSISSTLAEIYLRDFDAEIRSTKRVYYYRRFVDDMILLASEDASVLLNQINEKLKVKKLNLNSRKTVAISESSAKTAEFDYLGYKFTRGQLKRGKPNMVTVSISEAKLARLHQRIDESFASFYAHRDWALLQDRIKLLTGNYLIKKSSHETPIRTGIFYSYSEITTVKTQLAEVDIHLRSHVIGLRAFLNRHKNTPQATLARKLLKYSIVSGWENQILHRFSQARLEQINKAWSE